MTTTRAAKGTGQVYAWYLIVQAVLGIVFWIVLTSSGTVRSWLELMPARHEVMDAFVFADVSVVVIGSALSAWALRAQKSWAVPVVAFTAGGIVYPTLYLLGWVSFTGVGAPLLAGMVFVSTVTCWIAYQVWKLQRPR